MRIQDQKVSVLQTVCAFTYNGACASFEEERKGSIEVGKLADLVVLDGSMLSSSSPQEMFRGDSDRDPP